MSKINDRSVDIGEYISQPDDSVIICRCEEITKGEIRKAVHEGMFTITEIRRYLRTGMGLCQGQTCSKLVRGIVARELGISPSDLEVAMPRASMRPIEMKVLGNEKKEGNNMKNSADVIIIGSGVIGNAAAYYLAKKGCSVIVLEKSDNIGDGGSSRNGGGVRQSGRDKRELPLAIYGVKNLWPTLSEELGMDVEYYKDGNLRLGKTPEHIKILSNLSKNATESGLDVKMISDDEARKICPYLSEEVIGASWYPTDGHANPLMTTLAFYRKARQLGVRFITGEEVIEIKK